MARKPHRVRAIQGDNRERPIGSAVTVRAKRADKTRSNAALNALEGQIPSDLADFRGKVETVSNIASSDSAYWTWPGAARSADAIAPFVRATVGATIYYTHSGFGNVAATVNVGHPATNYASVNGIHARFQAHTAAVMALMDRVQFPDVQGQMQERPEGWTRRLP